MKNLYSLTFFLLLCVIWSNGCIPNVEQEITITLTKPTISVSPTPLRTATSIPTLIPFSIATTTPTPQILPTTVPTITPTLTVTEKEAILYNLFESYTTCLLPCWWGIVPGQTSWFDIKGQLIRLSYDLSSYYQESELIGIELVFPGIEFYRVFHASFGIKDKIIQTIDSAVIPIPAYALSKILTTYGQPSEVWLRSQSFVNPETGTLPVSINLWYPTYGFILGYVESYSSMAEDGTITSCLGEETTIHITIWEPSQVNMLDYTQVAQQTVWFRPNGYELPLEEATDLTLETFYNTYRDASVAPCIQTPSDIWPGM